MDVAERPVVEPDRAQVLEGAGAVVVIAGGGPSHVAVQHADLDPRPGRWANRRARFSRSLRWAKLTPWTVASGTPLALDGQRARPLPAEDRDAFGPGPAERRPTRLDRVVVAVHDEARDTGVRQAGEAVPEAQLRPQAPLGPVVDVAGDDEEGGLALQAQLDEGVERGQRGLAKPFRHPAAPSSRCP